MDVEGYRKFFADFKSRYSQLNYAMSRVRVKVYGDPAVLCYRLTTSMDDNSYKNGLYNVTAVYVRQGDVWRRVHRHQEDIREHPLMKLRDLADQIDKVKRGETE
jgi:hypothetical protein